MTYDRAKCTTASNAQADLLCPGRFLAQQLVPPEPPKLDPDAAHGRFLHKALALGNKTGLTLEQEDTYDSCQEIEAGLLSQFFGMDVVTAVERVWREKPIVMRLGDYEHGATPDVVYRHGNRALILEYKTLSGDVPASPMNMQLRDQVVLVNDRFVTLETIGCAVIQPLVTHSPELCVYSREDIAQAAAELFERVHKSHDPTSPRIPGPVQCQFCRAKELCVEYQKWASVGLPAKVDLTDIAIANWTPEQCAVFCETYPVWEKWIELGKEHIKERLTKDPASVPGWHLKPGNKPEVIIDPQTVFARFEAAGGKLEQFMATIGVYKGKLKEALAAVSGAKGKALDKMLATLLAGCVKVKENAPSLERDKGEK